MNQTESDARQEQRYQEWIVKNGQAEADRVFGRGDWDYELRAAGGGAMPSGTDAQYQASQAIYAPFLMPPRDEGVPGGTPGFYGREFAVPYKPPVSEEVIPIVSGLDRSVVIPLISEGADELYLPGEGEDAQYWQINGLAEPDFLKSEALQGRGKVQSVALSGVVALVLPLILDLILMLALDWLLDRLSVGDKKFAVYLHGRLIGYTSEEGMHGIPGLQTKEV